MPTLAERLSVGVEDLIDYAPNKRGAAKREPAPKLQQQLEQVHALPVAQQRAIAQVLLDSMLTSQLAHSIPNRTD